MWIVAVGLLLHLSFSNNIILFLVNITLGVVLLLTTNNLMSDNIEFLYLLSSILFTLHAVTGKRIFIVVKLITDFVTYIFVGTIIDYHWIFTLPIVLDVLQLALVKKPEWRQDSTV